MRLFLSLFTLVLSLNISGRTLQIIKLNTKTIKIGNNDKCSKGSEFEDNQVIYWDRPKQDMWVKVISGKSRELLHFSREAFMSKHAKTAAEYINKINKLSTMGDEMSFLPAKNSELFSQKRIALVIGNSNYEFLSSLNNPINDVADISEKLQNLGFDVHSFYDINYRDFDTALKKFSGAANSYDVALIYFCGHGIQYNGLNYLIPVENKLASEDDILSCIDIEDIYSKLKRTNCKTKLLFLDACRNEVKWSGKIEQFKEQDTEDIRIVFSTGPNKFSYDRDGNRNSPFAEAFLNNVSIPSESIVLTINNIARSLNEICERMGLPQQEVHDFGSSLIDFSFIDKKSDIRNLLSEQVSIDVKLLDSIYIKIDPTIADKINYNSYMGISEEDDLGPFYDTFHYYDTIVNNTYTVRPTGDYVGDYYLNDSIVIQTPLFLMMREDEYTNTHHPILDVSIVNNSSNTLLVNELLIDVEDSYIDKNPFVILYETEGKIIIEDRGWKKWENAILKFSLLPECQKFDSNYKFTIPINADGNGQTTINMYYYLEQSGIDFKKLCTNSLVSESEFEGNIPNWYADLEGNNTFSIDSLRKFISPVEIRPDENVSKYIDPYLVLHGQLVFDNGHLFKVRGNIRFLTSEEYGAPYLNCTNIYDIKLRNEGSKYTIKYPVSHYLKSGEADRFAIQFDAEKTSYHKFKIRLKSSQIDISTQPIDMLIFKYNN